MVVIDSLLRSTCICCVAASLVGVTATVWGQSDHQLREIISSNGIQPLEPLERVDASVFELGQSLFFDKELSGNRDMACATCHHPSLATGDAKSLSIGTMGQGLGDTRTLGEGRDFIPRNAPEIFERGVTEWTTMFWDSRVERYPDGKLITPAGDKLPSGVRSLLGAQAMFPVTSAAEMRGSRGDLDIHGQPNELAMIDESDLPVIWDAITKRLMNIDEYVEMFQKAYPNTPRGDFGFEHAGEAIGAFEAQAFTFTDSPWDRYLAGDNDAMTESSKRGALLFHGKGQCSTCHSGSLFTDQQHHNIGVPQLGPGKADPITNLDLGRSRVSGVADDDFAFRTPSLRNTAITGPWMHDGAYSSLEQAINHYSDRLQALANYDANQLEEPLRDRVHLDPNTMARMQATLSNQGEVAEPLTPEEVQDLLAFLGSLTTTSIMELEDIIPDLVPSGLEVDRMPAVDELELTYDPRSGNVGLRGPEGSRFDGVQLKIGNSPDGQLPPFAFNSNGANWLGQSVFFSTDLADEQTFRSLLGVLGEFAIENNGSLGELLPAGLNVFELERHLSSRVSIVGQPGTAVPQLVFIPEPSTWLLVLNGMATLGLACRRHRRQEATCN